MAAEFLPIDQGMPLTLADLAIPALWTFQRGEETLSVMREVVDGRATLTISDATTTQSTSFEDVVALVHFQTNLEGQLLAEGWSLAAFAPDLRSGDDRRRAPRANPDRRQEP